jgi:3-oxoacyl-[acyl-carrier protein] reductase
MDTVLVTGATGGIGSAVATALAGDDTHVVLSARDEEDLEEVAAEIEGPNTIVRADVRDEYDVERLTEAAARTGEDGITLVCPSAGVYHGEAGKTPLAEESYAAFDDTLRTNIRGVFATIRESVPHLEPDGRVIVPTGAVASGTNSGYGAYAVSKAGAEAVMRGFAAELDQAVGCVDPGVVATDLTGQQGRDPEEVAGLFRWAANVEASTLNGEILDLRAWRQAETE